jgi:nicotinate-nucleotide adenylyltransferase
MRGTTADFAILGGTFDPIHIMHLIIASGVIQRLHLKKCIFIPAAVPPHKEKVGASGIQRLEMVQLAIQDNPQFQVLDIELVRSPQPSYTYDTLKEIKRIFSCASPIPFIVGADTLTEIPTWHNYPQLLEELIPVVIDRWGYPEGPVQPEIMKRVVHVDLPRMELSSTLIREMVASGESIRYLVPKQVEEYIVANRLYRKT